MIAERLLQVLVLAVLAHLQDLCAMPHRYRVAGRADLREAVGLAWGTVTGQRMECVDADDFGALGARH